MTILLLSELKSAGQLKVMHDARKRSLLDFSGNNLTLAAPGVGSGNQFEPTAWGTGFGGTVNTEYTAGVQASLDLTTATAFYVVIPMLTTYAPNSYIISKSDGGGTLLNGYNVYLAGSGTVCLGDAVGFQALATISLTGVTGRPLMAVHTWNGIQVVSYKNGIFVNSTAQTRVPASAGRSYRLGWPGGVGLHSSPLLLAGMINRVLSSAEVARLYDEFMQDDFVLDVQHRRGAENFVQGISDSEYTRQGIILDTDFRRQPGGLIRDLTGNYSGTATGIVVAGAEGKGGRFPSANDNISWGDVTQLNSTATFALETEIELPTGNIPTSYLHGKIAGAVTRIATRIATAPATTQPLYTYISNGADSYGYTTATVLRAGCKHHIMQVYNGAGATDALKHQVYVDGEAYALTFGPNPLPATTANLAGNALFSGFTAVSTPCTHQKFRLHSGAPTAGQARAAFLRNYGQKVIWQAPGEDMPVSLVASYGTGTPNALGGGWRIVAGTHKISENTKSERWIECVTGGATVRPQPYFYGTYAFSVHRAADVATALLVQFQASLENTYLAANQNGYCLYVQANRAIVLATVTNGIVVAVLVATGAAYIALNTRYDFIVSRRPSDGRFTVYIKGGAYTSWTLMSAAGGGSNPTAAETTYMASSFFSVNLAAGDKFLIHDPTVPGCPCPTRIWRGVLDPTRNEVQ